jgi:hypothetical protein
MNEAPGWQLPGWRYGIHPSAPGMRVHSLGRVAIELGEALRLELVDDPADEAEIAHLQYYVVTEAGPWALWLTCPRDDLAAREAALQQLSYPSEP